MSRSYRVAEVYMFDACTHRCGYCWLAESGRVLDHSQLERFRDPEFIDAIVRFFNSRTEPRPWLLTFTGGEPLLAPRLDHLCRGLFEAGNAVSFYTALLVGEKHPGFRFLMESSYPEVDYVMASLHPESEERDFGFFDKLAMLRDRGHRTFLRYVAHPARLDHLDDLAERCRQMDVTFYPTTLMSPTYPGAYASEDRERLSEHFVSLSQFVQLEGGLDTMVTECYAGSRILAVNLQSGAVTPCITVPGPLLGNIFEDRLDLFEERPGKCTAQGVNCICDVHFQQNVVVGAEDAARFNELGRGSVAPRGYVGTIESMKANGGKFYGNPDAGMGNVEDMTRLAFTAEEVRKRFRLSGKATAAMPADVWEDPPARLAGEGRLAAFALSDLVPTESGSVEPGSRPELTTSPLQWAYVAVLPLPISADAGSGLSLRARFQVLEGSVGVGVLACDEKAFLSEGIVRAGEGRETTVRLPLPSPPATGPLIFRNVAANGVASRARLTSVELWGRAEALDAGNISGGPSNG